MLCYLSKLIWQVLSIMDGHWIEGIKIKMRNPESPFKPAPRLALDLILVLSAQLLSASWWPVDDLRKHEWRHDTVDSGRHRGDLLPRWRFHLGLPETRICWVVHCHYHYHRTSAWLLIFISDLHAYEGLEKYYTAHIEVRQGIYKINNVVLQFLILNL